MARGKKSHETIAEESRAARLLMHRLMQEGMSESDALRQALPNDGNRARTKRLWESENHKLWPIPPELAPMPTATVESPVPQTVAATDVQPPTAEVPSAPEPSPVRTVQTPSETIPVREVQNVSESITRQEFESAIAEIVARIEGVEAKMPTIQTVQNVSETYPPEAPAPPLEGKGHAVTRDKLGITLDPALHELVKEEAKRRGVSISRVFDTALWYYYGQPRLSFQTEKTTDPTEGEPS